MIYQCYIKSHCDYPDFEIEVEADSKDEALDVLLTSYHLGLAGWDAESLAPHVGAEQADSLSVALQSERQDGVGANYS